MNNLPPLVALDSSQTKVREDVFGIEKLPNGDWVLYLCFPDVWPEESFAFYMNSYALYHEFFVRARSHKGFVSTEEVYPFLCIKLVLDSDCRFIDGDITRTSGKISALLYYKDIDFEKIEHCSDEVRNLFSMVEDFMGRYGSFKSYASLVSIVVKLFRANAYWFLSNSHQNFILCRSGKVDCVRSRESNVSLHCFCDLLKPDQDSSGLMLTTPLKSFVPWLNMGLVAGIFKLGSDEMNIMLKPDFFDRAREFSRKL
ncbi:MAG: hypothetical protein OXR68_02345 [Alphaproteobacteria bacterium]|nr:hypothetical protein [Alphaproteobacteria bacterium]